MISKKINIHLAGPRGFCAYPWEIDAFGRQLGLFVRMCEETGNTGEEMMETT